MQPHPGNDFCDSENIKRFWEGSSERPMIEFHPHSIEGSSWFTHCFWSHVSQERCCLEKDCSVPSAFVKANMCVRHLELLYHRKSLPRLGEEKQMVPVVKSNLSCKRWLQEEYLVSVQGLMYDWWRLSRCNMRPYQPKKFIYVSYANVSSEGMSGWMYQTRARESWGSVIGWWFCQSAVFFLCALASQASLREVYVWSINILRTLWKSARCSKLTFKKWTPVHQNKNLVRGFTKGTVLWLNFSPEIRRSAAFQESKTQPLSKHSLVVRQTCSWSWI